MASDSVPSGDMLARSATENASVALSKSYVQTSENNSEKMFRRKRVNQNQQPVIERSVEVRAKTALEDSPLIPPLIDVQSRDCASTKF